MVASRAPDKWIGKKIYLDLGEDEGFIDEKSKPVGLTLEEVSHRGILALQPHEDIMAPTFYPWRSIRRIIGPDKLSRKA